MYVWSGSDLSDTTDVFTVRNQSYSSAPQLQSGCLVTLANSWEAGSRGGDFYKYIATIATNQVPLNTTLNYSTSTTIGGVICVSAMDKTVIKARSARAQGRSVLGSMTHSERKAL